MRKKSLAKTVPHFALDNDNKSTKDQDFLTQ